VESTVHSIVKNSAFILLESGSPTPEIDAEVLIAHILRKDRSWLYAYPDFVIPAKKLKYIEKAIERRASHEPVAYITSVKEFYGREFAVNEHVLVPRPESEAIVDALRETRYLLHSEHCSIVDVGTGSGCLAITAKLELEARSLTKPSVIAIDISKDALSVAQCSVAER
jgi:release factor glutamine methyltransferase